MLTVALQTSFFKCTRLWFLVYLQGCATITTIPEHCHRSKTETLYPLAAIPYFLLPPVPDNHASTFYHYGFAHLGHCIYMISYNQWFWVTAFFPLAWCFIHVVAYQYFIPFLD